MTNGGEELKSTDESQQPSLIPEPQIVPDLEVATRHWGRTPPYSLSPKVATMRCGRLLERGEAQDALDMLRKSLLRANDNVELGGILYDIAICHWRLGRKETCVETLGNAIWICPPLLEHFKRDTDFAELLSDADAESRVLTKRDANTAIPCPICGDSQHMASVRVLYRMLVCKKCYRAFAARRYKAFLLDTSVFVMAPFCGGVVEYMNTVAEHFHGGGVAIGVCLAALWFLFKDGFGGRVSGKTLFGLSVVDELNGKPLGVGRSYLRQFGIFSPMSIGLGYMNMTIATIGSNQPATLAPFFPLILLADSAVPFLWLAYIACELRHGYRPGDTLARSKVIWREYSASPVFLTGDEYAEPLSRLHERWSGV